jgi:hypothetical protein
VTSDELAVILADALFSAIGMSREPHIDIFEAARRAAVDTIEFAPILSDGRIENTPGYTRVTLKSRASRERQRFTLAHELGHVLLDDPSVAVQVRRLHPDLDDVERLCEVFAAEVLMPREWVRTVFQPLPQGFNTLGMLARRAGVSMSAALVQLVKHARWPTTLLYFSKAKNWELSVMAGAPRNVRGRINADYQTRCAVAESYSRHANGECKVLRLELRGHKIEVRSELKAAGSGVLALVPLRHTLADSGLLARPVHHRRPARGF